MTGGSNTLHHSTQNMKYSPVTGPSGKKAPLLLHAAIYLKARGPVEELHHVTYARLRGLWKARLKSLDYKQNQDLPGQC